MKRITRDELVVHYSRRGRRACRMGNNKHTLNITDEKESVTCLACMGHLEE